MSIDKLTNEIDSIPVDKVYIKPKVANIDLDMKAVGILKNGGTLRAQNIELADGKKFTADLQYSASKRDLMFVNYDQYRQKQGQEKSQGGDTIQQVRDSWHNADGSVKLLEHWCKMPLNEHQQADYLAGKKVLVGEGKDKFGNDCTIYFQYDPEKRQPQTTRVYPDQSKVVGIAEESLSRSAFEESRKNTQVSVNNQGKTNESTKNDKEPLQRGQTAPKDESQQQKQSKPKGPKL